MVALHDSLFIQNLNGKQTNSSSELMKGGGLRLPGYCSAVCSTDLSYAEETAKTAATAHTTRASFILQKKSLYWTSWRKSSVFQAGTELLNCQDFQDFVCYSKSLQCDSEELVGRSVHHEIWLSSTPIHALSQSIRTGWGWGLVRGSSKQGIIFYWFGVY